MFIVMGESLNGASCSVRKAMNLPQAWEIAKSFISVSVNSEDGCTLKCLVVDPQERKTYFRAEAESEPITNRIKFLKACNPSDMTAADLEFFRKVRDKMKHFKAHEYFITNSEATRAGI